MIDYTSWELNADHTHDGSALAELLDAFEFVSSGAPFEHSAYICADTGAIYWASSMIDLEEKVPDNLETSDRYIAVPHKNDLNLGRNLALFFVEQELPDDYNTVAGFFRTGVPTVVSRVGWNPEAYSKSGTCSKQVPWKRQRANGAKRTQRARSTPGTPWLERSSFLRNIDR